jgi:hypothetical protein
MQLNLIALLKTSDAAKARNRYPLRDKRRAAQSRNAAPSISSLESNLKLMTN